MGQQPVFPAGVWAVDFEFHPAHGHEGNLPDPVCMVARELQSKTTIRLWQDDLKALSQAPFPVGADALCVAYFASAEMACFLALGWTLPANVADLYVEFRRATNGLPATHGNGLLGALLHYGLPAIADTEKGAMRDLVLGGGPWSPSEKRAILEYCESDVVALERLLPVMCDQIDWPRARIRGHYMQSVARIETNGVPMDHELCAKLQNNWDVSVSAWHLEPKRVTPDHRVYGERGGSDLQGSEGLARALAVDRCLYCLRGPAEGRVVGAARLFDLVDVSRPASSDEAAVGRSGCSTAWAAA